MSASLGDIAVSSRLTPLSSAAYDTHMGIKEKEHTSIIRRLRRIEGQVRGVQRMLEENRPIEEIVTQMAACNRAFDEAGLLIIAEHMKGCLDKASPNCEEAVREALDVFVRFANYIR